MEFQTHHPVTCNSLLDSVGAHRGMGCSVLPLLLLFLKWFWA